METLINLLFNTETHVNGFYFFGEINLMQVIRIVHSSLFDHLFSNFIGRNSNTCCFFIVTNWISGRKNTQNLVDKNAAIDNAQKPKEM